jgi:poly-gamma-glutamate capsule biosynthesis protein CapA/YwtB (metallophosphatase superfamily)
MMRGGSLVRRRIMEGPPRVVMCAVGDVLVDREDPPGIWRHVAHVLGAADLLFGNCEGVYTDRSGQSPSTHAKAIVKQRNVTALGVARFSVMSGANNHIVDAGHEGLIDTLHALHDQGIVTCGFGRNIEEARRPAILERGGVRYAFLAYSCVYPVGYQARRTVPGLAPIRVHTVYHADGDSHSPGAVPEIYTVPYPEDVALLREDIAAARAEADVVVGSFHWGEANRPAVLHNYERSLAYEAIDAGVDVVLGHHHHVLRGIEWYQEHPIFYGLGHFVFDLPDIEGRTTEGMLEKWRQKHGEYALGPREGWPLLPFHPDARLTVIAYLRFAGSKIEAAGIIPCTIVPNGCVVPHRPEEEDGHRVLEYLARVTREAGLDTRYEILQGTTLGSFPVVGVIAGTREQAFAGVMADA